MFKDQCANAQCFDAVRGILSTISGKGSFLQCDMLTVLYEGNPEGNYYMGVRDHVVAKSAYLLTLVSMGVVAESAYQTINTNDKEAWTIVQNAFQSELDATFGHINDYNGKCKSELLKNVELNTHRMLHEHPNDDNPSWANMLFEMAKTMAPENLV